MTANEELGQRLAAVEGRLGMDQEPPLDRLSTIEFKIDGLRALVNHLGITQGEHSAMLARLEAIQLTQGRKLDEVQTGISAIATMLATLIGRGEPGEGA